MTHPPLSSLRTLIMSQTWGRIKRLFPTPIKQISLEIDDELQFHLDSSIKDLLDEHRDPSDAFRTAHERFGDVSEIRAELISIGTRPWRRFIATTAAVSSLCVLMCAAGLILWSAQVKERVQVESTLRDELGRARIALMSAEQQDEPFLAQTVRFISIQGAVTSPRDLTLTRTDPITLGQLIAESGGIREDATGRVYITLHSDPSHSILIYNLDDIRSGTSPDPVLPKSCTVSIEAYGDLTGPETHPND